MKNPRDSTICDKLFWTVVRCPIYDELRKLLISKYRHLRVPWSTYANQCLKSERFASQRTHILMGFHKDFGLISTAWLSLPDKELLFDKEPCAFLFNLHVLSDHRNRGIGTVALEHACEFLQKRGFHCVMLATDSSRDFYENIGFRQVGDDPWLMSYEMRMPRPSDLQPYVASMSKKLIRSVSIHDLATIQSICGQVHWNYHKGQLSFAPATEYEEEFCEIMKKQVRIQFFLRGTYTDQYFVCWAMRKDRHWWLRVLFDAGKDHLIIICEKLLPILDRLTTSAPDELRSFRPDIVAEL